MENSGKARVRYYETYADDFTRSRDRSCRIPSDYQWIRKESILSDGLYAALGWAGRLYCRAILHVKIENPALLREGSKGGGFLYGNHTQTLGDVFLPAWVCHPRRIYTLASPANLGIPVLGSLLPYLGALPVPDTVAGMRNLWAAIQRRLEEGAWVVIYPEAHVWDYCTEIRPFSAASFKFPAKLGVPVYVMTTTYQKRRRGKKPGITVYLDGPFHGDDTLPLKKRAEELRQRVQACMTQRSKASTYAYITYEKRT